VNQLVARDALTSSVKRVSLGDRAGLATPSVFAVFETGEPDATLMGLVTLEQAAGFSQRIFADLLPRRRGEPVRPDADLETVTLQMEGAPAGALAVVDDGGQLLGAVTRESLAGAMLTQQRSLMSELATREAQQRAMLNAIPDDLLCVSADGKLLQIHRVERSEGSGSVRCRLLELKDSDGKSIAEVFPPDVAATLIEGVRHSLASGAPTSRSFSIRGRETTSQYDARFVSWGDDNVLIICHDVTEVNALRAKLIVSDRMVSIGTLAAGVAHEINNPMTYVSANLGLLTDMLTREMVHNDHLREATPMLEDIRDGVDRVQRTVRDLKLFSRSEEPSRAVVDLRSVLERVLRIADNEIRHRATLSLDFGPVPRVDANDSQVGQVFLNLLVNAAQSIPEGAADRNQIRVVTRTDPEGRAVIEIHDTGVGIADAIKPRIFAPFFTTKGDGAGTGLGLSICHGIVTAHGGQIELDSVEGRGSVFRVLLPASTAEPAAAFRSRSPEPPRALLRPSGRFLAVDDEIGILSIYRRLLGADQCVTCSSGADALALLRRGERFDAILCDLMMPQTSGMDVHDELIRTAPDLAARMVFVTGGAFTDRARQFLALETNPVLDKPFDSNRLFTCMADVLEKHPPPAR
jgi:signal transduction histidine kinase/CheY-like chemotaxis protein